MADVKVGAVTVELQVRIPAEQLATILSAEQVLALLGGIGTVVAAGATLRDEPHVPAALPPAPAAVKKPAPAAPTGAVCPMPGCGKEAGHFYRHRGQGKAKTAAPAPPAAAAPAGPRVPVDPLRNVVELPAPPPGPKHGPSRLMQHFDRKRGGR